MIAFPKPKRWESTAYIKWIKEQSCIECGDPAEPHHIKGVGYLSGWALKAPDWAVMPLCHRCHDVMQNTPEKWPEQWEMIARTLGRAIDEGFFGKKGAR